RAKVVSPTTTPEPARGNTGPNTEKCPHGMPTFLCTRCTKNQNSGLLLSWSATGDDHVASTPAADFKITTIDDSSFLLRRKAPGERWEIAESVTTNTLDAAKAAAEQHVKVVVEAATGVPS